MQTTINNVFSVYSKGVSRISQNNLQQSKISTDLKNSPSQDNFNKKEMKTSTKVGVGIVALLAGAAIVEFAKFKGQHLKALFKKSDKQLKKTDDNVVNNIIKKTNDNVNVDNPETIKNLTPTNNDIKIIDNVGNIEEKTINKLLEMTEAEFVGKKLAPLLEEIAQVRIELKNTYARVFKGENVPAEEVEAVLNKYNAKQSEYVNLEWNTGDKFSELFESKHSIYADKLEAYLNKLASNN